MIDAKVAIVELGAVLRQKGLAHGSTGNISVRDESGITVTPTGTNLGALSVDSLSTIDLDGHHIGGPKPSKEAFLHAAMYRARPDASAIVHTHSTYATAVSCLADINDDDVLPPLTAYFAMRVGTLVRLPYFRPGDDALGPAAEEAATTRHALLLSNHGPIVAGVTLSEAADSLEEIEETSKLFLLLQGMRTRPLSPAQQSALNPPSIIGEHYDPGSADPLL